MLRKYDVENSAEEASAVVGIVVDMSMFTQGQVCHTALKFQIGRELGHPVFKLKPVVAWLNDKIKQICS